MSRKSECSSMATGATGSTTTVHPQRSYNTRLSTVSVTQLLSDSCSNLLNRIASRVRGPSMHSFDARHRRSKGPGSNVQEKTSMMADVSPSAFNQKNYRHYDLTRSSTADHLSDRLDHKYWTRNGKNKSKNVMMADDSKKWLSVPSYTAKCDRDRERMCVSRTASKNDLLEWRNRNFVNNHNNRSKRPGFDDIEPTNCDNRFHASYNLNNTRSRLQDKYYDMLDKSTSCGYKQRPLTKSATSVVLSEKAYPFVPTATVSSRRDKAREHTPYRDEKTRSERRHKSSSRRETVLYSFKPLKNDARENLNVSRLRLRSSSKESSRSRCDSPHLSVAKSACPSLNRVTRRDKIIRTKSCVNETDLVACHSLSNDEKSQHSKIPRVTAVFVDELKPVENHERLSSSTSDREIKRKEIQALIEKYAGLEEKATSQELPSVLVKCQKKYSAVLSTATADAGESIAKAVSVVGFLIQMCQVHVSYSFGLYFKKCIYLACICLIYTFFNICLVVERPCLSW